MLKINLKKFSLMRGGSFLGFGLAPHRDWKIILSGFIVLILLIIGFGSFLFYKTNYNGWSIDNQKETTRLNSLDLDRLGKAVTYYKDKATKFEEIKSNRGTTPDPSI